MKTTPRAKAQILQIPTTICIEYPSLDEAIFEGNPVLRGVVEQDSLPHLRIDEHYQREFLSPTTRRYIMDALVRHQRLPDIELGMRGENWTMPDDGKDIALLHDPVFIIDGQQRRGSVMEYLRENPEAIIRQGASVHFKTTMEWERERFHALNLHQTRVASSILLKNLRSTNVGIATLYGLAVADRDFPLRGRVTWAQTRGRNDLISANLYTRITLLVHGHIGSGIIATSVQGMQIGCDRLAELIGLPTFRHNVKTLWGTIENVWGLSTLKTGGAPWLKVSFLMAFANVLSDHIDFWNRHRLYIDRETIEKLKRFPINDPQIVLLAGASGQAAKSLEFHLIQHIDKGRRKFLERRPDPSLQHRADAFERVRERGQFKPGNVPHNAPRKDKPTEDAEDAEAPTP